MAVDPTGSDASLLRASKKPRVIGALKKAQSKSFENWSRIRLPYSHPAITVGGLELKNSPDMQVFYNFSTYKYEYHRDAYFSASYYSMYIVQCTS